MGSTRGSRVHFGGAEMCLGEPRALPKIKTPSTLCAMSTLGLAGGLLIKPSDA